MALSLLSVPSNVPLLLSAVLGDGNTSQYPRAFVNNSAGTEVAVVDLASVGRGKYQATWTPTITGYATVTYIDYSDPGHTTVNTKYNYGEDVFFISSPGVTVSISAPSTMLVPVAPDPNLTYAITVSITDPSARGLVPNSVPTISILNASGGTVVAPVAMTATGITGEYVYQYSLGSGGYIGGTVINVDTVVYGTTSTTVYTSSQALAGSSTAGGGATIADAVWNAILPGVYDINNSAGAIMQVIERNTDAIDNYITNDPNYSLPVIKSTIESGDDTTLLAVQGVSTQVSDLSTQSATETTQVINKIDTVLAMEGRIITAISVSTTTITTDIAGIDTLITTRIEPQTDLIIADPATTADTDALSVKLDLKPDQTWVANQFTINTASIKGLSNRNITQVYDTQRGTDNALLANDARLNFLDAAISSRSTVTDVDVWTYVSRTLTSAVVLDPASVWDYLSSAATVTGSMGKLIVDNLNVAVSTRSTLTTADLNAAVAPLALETTVIDSRNQILTQGLNTSTSVNNNTTLLNAIKPKTDLIVAGGATNANVNSNAATTNALINGVQTTVNAIKVKTDLIPVDPAMQSSVLAIPTNPLLDNDPRLDDLGNLIYLDMYISALVPLIPADYATAAALTASTNQIVADISTVNTNVLILPTTTYFDPKFAVSNTILTEVMEIEGTGFNTASDSLVSIKAAIPSSTTIVTDVWTAPTRDLTSYPAFSTPTDVTTSADSTVAQLTQYYCGMSTAINTVTATQKLSCWLVINSQMIAAATNARIVILDGTTIIWSGSVATPDASGIFSVTINASGFYSSGINYTTNITIDSGGTDYYTMQPFVAVT